MSDQSQGPGWWLASDGRWYPPEQHPSARPAPPPPPPPPPTGAPRPADRRPGPWLARCLALAVACVLLVGGVTVFLAVTQDGSDDGFDSEEVDDATLEDELEDEEADAELDELSDDCADGDMEACDDLYFQSPVGSEDKEFGSTCGDRREETEGECA